ncbi:phage tail assembly chaperone [Szabonella alba]|uniref:Uncharacterized protein n=1 Tax=Szabonella alba TaxID=2804194 RepID=A0A8K0VD91_9RHOB|nr:hypothetical protein [Szabonella alba]MBL4918966.1 hypothetical protein [Szabonella alba]
MQRLTRQLCAAVRASIAGNRVRPPEAGRPLWNAFQRLNATRTYHRAGPNPIQPSEVEALCRMMCVPFGPHHIAILLAMDQVWLDQVYAQKGAPEGVKTLPPISKQPLTAALFDLVVG